MISYSLGITTIFLYLYDTMKKIFFYFFMFVPFFLFAGTGSARDLEYIILVLTAILLLIVGIPYGIKLILRVYKRIVRNVSLQPNSDTKLKKLMYDLL